MAFEKSSPVGILANGLASWLLLIGGLALWAITLLVPAHLQVVQLEHKYEIMQQQAGHLTEQRHRYDEFQQAVARHEPVVLQLLAAKQLNLRPADRVAFRPDLKVSPAMTQQVNQPDIALVFFDGSPVRPIDVSARQPLLPIAPPLASANMDDWIYQPMPPRTYMPDHLPQTQTRLARLTSGHNRAVLAIAAGLLLLAGLWLR